jgi:hypothetical protein
MGLIPQMACKEEKIPTSITTIKNDDGLVEMNLRHRTMVMEMRQTSDIYMGDVALPSIILVVEKYPVIDKIHNLNIPFKVWIHFVGIISPGMPYYK